MIKTYTKNTLLTNHPLNTSIINVKDNIELCANRFFLGVRLLNLKLNLNTHKKQLKKIQLLQPVCTKRC